MAGRLMYDHKKGETPLDDLSGLKIKIPNITRSQLDEYEAGNIQAAVLKYYNRKKSPDFDMAFFQKLHKDMFGSVWSWAGIFRDTQTNIGSDPIIIRENLQILQMDLEYFDHNLLGGAMLHHRAVQIHPFKGGNGRWSRLISDLWLKHKAGIIIDWPVGLGIESDIRDEYLSALRAADGLDYGPLLTLYKKIVRG